MPPHRVREPKAQPVSDYHPKRARARRALTVIPGSDGTGLYDRHNDDIRVQWDGDVAVE